VGCLAGFSSGQPDSATTHKNEKPQQKAKNMPSKISPQQREISSDDLVVYNGLQYQAGDLPDGVSAKDLPTLAEWFAANRVTAKKPAANKSAS
jgi:hypothetical protein